jgi:hypothetical protein
MSAGLLSYRVIFFCLFVALGAAHRTLPMRHYPSGACSADMRGPSNQNHPKGRPNNSGSPPISSPLPLLSMSSKGSLQRATSKLEMPLSPKSLSTPIATTGHKLQGMTKDALVVNEWNYRCANWVYIVLSRVRTCKGLFLLHLCEFMVLVRNQSYKCLRVLILDLGKLGLFNRHYLWGHYIPVQEIRSTIRTGPHHR